MDASEQLIIVNGKDKTESVVSVQFRGSKCDVVFDNSSHVYSYNSSNVRIIKLKQVFDPNKIIFKYKGTIIADIDQVRDFGEFYRVIRAGKKELSCRRTDVQISQNCLAEAHSKELFQYFKDTATAVSLKTENGINILKLQYDKIVAVDDCTVLSRFLKTNLPVEKRNRTAPLIFPFGLNQSQKVAVENAFSSQVSIIQGPPGTGKTQTILNIIANAVRYGKSVAVVSNNNSAILNIAEKMENQGVDFLTAFLGSQKNKNRFLDTQNGTYPNMQSWLLDAESKNAIDNDVAQLSEELDTMLNSRNRIAEIDQELLALKPEHFYFEKYYKGKRTVKIDAKQLARLTSGKLLSLWLEYEFNSGKKLGFFKKIFFAIRFSRAALSLFSHVPEDAIPFVQDLYYKNKMTELYEEKKSLEAKLRDYHFDAKMKELGEKSMKLFKSELAYRYQWQQPRLIFEKEDFRGKSDEFNKEYPIILSTTYSIKGTLSTGHIYDYIIVDEASQVDLATGVLAFSCAKNIIIVGDQQQLPNVLTYDDIRIADDIWNKHNFDEHYRFSTHSMLAAATEIWSEAPSVLLREHYRCHPKIANFFNQKFYNGQLIVMTEDHGEDDVLSMYRTAPGNHARGHMNQRQIDVVQNEILPVLKERGYRDIGIITPYHDQEYAIQRQFGNAYDVATVHKFQGREKDAIVLVSVDNIIGEFVDNPNLLNVAVSRAVKSLTVVISDSKENEKTNYGDLAKYIEYNNFQIVESKVFSVFDLLYKGYYKQRKDYFIKHKRVSEYDSENIAYAVIKKILSLPEFSKIDCAVHSSVATLIRDYSLMTDEEARYASNPLTHLDFLLFSKMDKKPIMAIEIDGTRFHAEGSRQAERDLLKNSVMEKYGLPLLRIRTNESGVEKRIITKLREIL